MSQTDPTLISQISKKHRDVVHSILEHDGGNLSRDEFYRRTKEKRMTERGILDTATRYVESLSQVEDIYGCTHEEAEAMVVAAMFKSHLLYRGVARRIMTGDPGELEAALSLSARFDWIDTCYPSRQSGESYPDIWFALHGLAAGDIKVARAILQARCHDSDRGHKPTVLIYDAVESIVMKDRPAQARIAPRIAKCKMPDWFRAILETLQGIIEADSSMVATGLERVLATFRRQQDPLDYEMIISLHAHGLAELAYWVSPKLLAKFEVDRPLPWDRAYYHWLRRKPRTTAYLDLSAYSSLLNRWVHDLEEPDWWHRERESAGENQPMSGSASISEDAGSEESEEVPMPAGCASAILMIRAAAPARRNRACHALELRDIGRREMESVSGSGEEMIPWLKNDLLPSDIRPWVLSVRFKGERWIHCIASRPTLVSVERLASNKDLQVLTANFDPQEDRTVALFFKGGTIAAELTLAGKGDDPLEVLGFKSAVKTKAFLKRCQTVRQAVDGFFAEFDGKSRDLVVVKVKSGLRLMDSDGKAIRATEMDELALTYYAL